MAVRIFATSACTKQFSSGSPISASQGCVLVAAGVTTTGSALVSWYNGTACTAGTEMFTLAACPGQPTTIFTPPWPIYCASGFYIGFVSGAGSAFSMWKP